MKTEIIGLLALPLLLSNTALAADMPVKAPRPVPPPYSWSGFYIGGNVGYGWGNADVDANLPVSGVPSLVEDTINDFVSSQFPGADVGFDSFTTSGISSFSQSNRMRGVIGGGQIGFNAQAGAFVFGLEADFQGSGQKGSVSRSDPFSGAASGTVSIQGLQVATFDGTLTGTSDTNYETKIDWFGTVRGRVGVAANTVLFYGTGGLAYGRVKLDGSVATTGVVSGTATPIIGGPIDFGPTIIGPDIAGFGRSKVNLGWTAGGGIEWAATNNLSFKVEYLFIDLGSLDIAGTTPAGLDYSLHAKFTDQIVRVGLNYKFNVPAPY